MHRLCKIGLTPDALDPPRADAHVLEALLQLPLECWLSAGHKELGDLCCLLIGGELTRRKGVHISNGLMGITTIRLGE